MQQLENWKRLSNFPMYEVSDLGRIRKPSEKLLLKPQSYKGYLKISLLHDGHRHRKLVHRLIAETFIPNPENKPEVNHKDRDKSNNCVGNLEWVTKKENMDHYYANSNHTWLRGEESPLCTISDDQVRRIFSLREQGWSLDRISKDIGCNLAHVSDILNGVVRTNLGLEKPKVDCRSKMTDGTVLEIFKLRELGHTYKEIGEKVGWNKATIGEVIRGKRVNGSASYLPKPKVDGRSRTKSRIQHELN